MPGRPAKPYFLHKIQGTYQKSRHEGKFALPAGDPGPAPEWFGEEARLEWDRITSDKEYMQCVAAVHRGALIEYCFLHGRMIDAASDDCNPAIEPKDKRKIAASERQMLGSLRMQLGLTPASQSKVKAPTKTAEKSEWADL
jgi:P27 family predicted phage terminase small subunit